MDNIQLYIEKCLDEEIRLLISDFAILWNKFENDFFEQNYHFCKFEDKVLCRIDIKNIDLKKKIYTLKDELFIYFESRGIDTPPISSEKIICNYNIRIPNDITKNRLDEIIKCEGTKNTLMFIMLIVGRVRNNMFHGIKDIGDLPKQRQLFKICNEVLKLMLERNF